MSILLRVVSPSTSGDHQQNSNKKITFISVLAATTVNEACREALTAFFGPGKENENLFSLVIESGRTRIYNPYYDEEQQQKSSATCSASSSLSAPIACIEVGQLSMPLDPTWELFPYITNNKNYQRPQVGNCGNDSEVEEEEQEIEQNREIISSQIKPSSTPPWSVVAYLVKEDIVVSNNCHEGDNNNNSKPMMLRKFSQVNRQAVPKVPDGRIIQESILREMKKMEEKSRSKERPSQDDVVAHLIAEANNNNKKRKENMDDDDDDDDQSSDEKDEDLMSMTSLLPLRLQNLTNSLKPCAKTE